jgi:hypothetical protein
MRSFLVDESADPTNSFVLDCAVSSVDWSVLEQENTGTEPLKMDALIAKTATPPARMRPPRPSDPRGSFGGPPPGPRCLIISRKLPLAIPKYTTTYPLDFVSSWRMRTSEEGGSDREKISKVESSQFSSPHGFNPNCDAVP